MNNKMMLWAALLLGGFFLLRRKQTSNGPTLGNFAGTGASDEAYWNGIAEG
tara:strand:+ start:267 stop:419 length:153 start_codon:yes stop_codon:yes gene_type:complete